MSRLDTLFAAAQSGDPRARDVLVRGIYASLDRFFGRHCRYSPVEVEDMVQTALVLILRKMDGFVPEHPRAFEFLVFDAARSIRSTNGRSWAREYARRVFITPPAIANDTSPSARAQRSEALERLAEVIDELDSIDQQALRDWLASADWQELVAREGVARSTLRGRLMRALARVRKLVERANPALTPEPSTT